MSTKRFGNVNAKRINGTGVLQTNKLLSIEDFPNDTGLYVWAINGTADYADGDWIGHGEALTENGDIGPSGATANHLGDLYFNELDGTNDYLSSASSTFDDIGSFSAGLWVKVDPADSSAILMEKADSGDSTSRGWDLFLASSNRIFFRVYQASNSAGGTITLDPYNEFWDGNWHHIVGVYDQSATSMTLVIDGKVVGHIVDAGNLASRYNGGTSTDFAIGGDSSGSRLTGFIADAFYKKTALTPNEVRKIYAAGCQRFVTEAGDSAAKVAILDGRQNNGHFYKLITNTDTITATAVGTAAPGYTLHIPESGLYRIRGSVYVSTTDTAASTGEATVRMRIVGGASGTTAVNGAYAESLVTAVVSSGTILPAATITQHPEIIVHASAGDIIQLEMWKPSSVSSVNLSYNSGVREPYFMWEKLD